MKIRLIPYLAVLVSAILSHAAPGFGGQAECEIPFQFQQHLIVMKASIGRTSGLKFMIDTAATGIVVDKKLIKAQGMKQLPGESQISALGQVSKARRFQLPKLQMGPVYTILQLHCSEADLSGLGIDGIIGADLLGQQTWLATCETNEAIKSRSFTIDFEARRLRFGFQQQREHTVPMEARNSRIIVVVMVLGRPLRLAVDTGTYTTVLYKESQMDWLQPWTALQSERFIMVGGMSRGKQVLLPGMELGNSRWNYLTGILMDLPNKETDGVLSIAQLDLKILHFDFERNLMSWKK